MRTRIVGMVKVRAGDLVADPRNWRLHPPGQRAFLRTFPGGGVSGVVILKESHITVHTWPEIGYAAWDVFACGQGSRLRPALDFLRGAMPGVASETIHYRGLRAELRP